ncbi:MAG: TolC family protein [Candidatus Omnitrophota bacterium]
MKRHHKVFIYCLAGFVYGVLPCALAQEASTQEVLIRESYPLSLEEATQLALRNNFDVQLAKYDAKISRTNKQSSKSIYDTVIDAEIRYQNDQSKRTSTLMGTKVIDNDYNIGLSKKLPTGTTVGVDMNNNRNWSNSSFVTSSLSHDSSLAVSVKQALGKNFFGIEDRSNIKMTLKDVESAEYVSMEKIENAVIEVQKAYWDLVLEAERLGIAQGIAEEAKKLYDLHEEKIKNGLVEYPELYASQANYKRRLNELKIIQNNFETKGNVLKLLLNIPDDAPVIVPQDILSLSSEKQSNDQSLQKAFASRYDYKKARSVLSKQEIKITLKENSLWPEINLTASLARNGLGDHFKQAVEEISEQDNPNLTAGLTVSFPLENNKALGELKASQLEKVKSLLELKKLERHIMIDVIDRVRDCNVFNEVAASQVEIADIERRKLEEEQKRFNYGRSNTDTIIRFQQDYLQSQFDAAQSKFNYYISLINLKHQEGFLLIDHLDKEI